MVNLRTEIILHKREPAIQSHINIKIDQVRKVFQAFSLEMPKFNDPSACKKLHLMEIFF
jgi:hypothetical protein